MYLEEWRTWTAHWWAMMSEMTKLVAIIRLKSVASQDFHYL